MSRIKQLIKFEYRKHSCVIFKEDKYWDADISPPNGVGSDYRGFPFRSRFVGRTLNKVIKMIDEDIACENESLERYQAMYDTPGPPKIHS